MKENNSIQLFENQRIRTAWNAEREEWLFSVVDVVGSLTDSVNPTDYFKKIRKRDELLGEFLGTNCPQVKMLTTTDKQRLTDVASRQTILESFGGKRFIKN